jgi:hypothetical protein
MRTSNKILLGIFLGPLIILTLIHVSLYAKYKSGNYVSMKIVEEDQYIRQPLKNITHIAVYGLNNFRIVPSDSAKLEIEKHDESHLHFTINGDSLIIHGDSIINRAGQPGNTERSYQAVYVYLPVSATIIAVNSEITVGGSPDSLKAKSYQLHLSSSASFKVEQNGDDSTPVYFKEMIIHADHASGIEFTANAKVGELQLNLVESEFTDNGASINKLTVDADKVSTITLKGDNLKKANLTKQP